jgi:hypothetical protein
VDWNAIGAIGEIIGAVAVVVTLIYLAGEVRHATRATQAANFEAASALEQEFLLTLGQDPATARTWAAYMFGDQTTLTDDERMQAMFLMGSLVRRLENIYHQHKLDTISDDAWLSRREMFSAVARSRAFEHFKTSPARGFVGQEFIDFMLGLSPRGVGPASAPPSGTEE